MIDKPFMRIEKLSFEEKSYNFHKEKENLKISIHEGSEIFEVN